MSNKPQETKMVEALVVHPKLFVQGPKGLQQLEKGTLHSFPKAKFDALLKQGKVAAAPKAKAAPKG